LKRARLNKQVSARKIIREVNDFNEVIKNEASVVTKLCMCGHPNIIQVFNHGRMSEYPYYFIDMELCDLTLDDYVTQRWAPQGEERGSYFMGKLSVMEKMKQTADILNDVTTGVAFIHQQKAIHRDLKPSNSKSPSFSV
jgi:serine/threonine protein kinase